METIYGSAIGYGGEEGQFSRLFRKLVRAAPESEIRSMMSAPNPAVRVMGFVVGIHRWPSERSALVELALRDTAEVSFVWGCDIMGQRISVARLVAEEAACIDEPFTSLRRTPPLKGPERTSGTQL